VKDQKSLLVSRYRISKKERRQLTAQLAEELGNKAAELVHGSENIEVAKLRHPKIEEIILVNGIPAFFRLGEEIYPTLLLVYRLNIDLDLPRIYVDAGAVPHILNGADVMVPGITRIEGEVRKGGKVFVAEEDKGRVFAVGKAIMDGNSIKESKRGKAVKNIHYAGDDLWNLLMKLF